MTSDNYCCFSTIVCSPDPAYSHTTPSPKRSAMCQPVWSRGHSYGNIVAKQKV